MPPCVEPRCAALAVEGDRCAVHRLGLRHHHVAAGAENLLRCSQCGRLVKDGDWYLLRDGVVMHASACPSRE